MTLPGGGRVTGDAPTWPDDVLYLPVEADGKGPDTAALPGTWGYDGTGCVRSPSGGRWGIVDVDADGWRLLTVDLDVYKMDGDRGARVTAAIDDAPETRIHESQSGGLHVFYWIRADELEDGKLPVILGEEIDDKLNGYVLSPHCDGYAVLEDRPPATITVDALPEAWVLRERRSKYDAAGMSEAEATHEGLNDLDVYDLISRASHPEGERVPHPVHGSSTGTNFMVDPGGETWRCWRHDCTGNALHLLGIEENIFECGEWV